MPRYANALEILPRELLVEVQKHFSGNLWIPHPKAFYDSRRELVLQLFRKGTTTKEISALASLTTRRVCQILVEARQTGEIPSK